MLKIPSSPFVRLIKNFISLALIQGTNFILPLLIIPYLIRTVGIEKFGIISLAQVVVLYFVIFSEYGFNLSATKEVSENRDNPAELKKIVNATISSRLFLSLVSFILLCFITFSFSTLRTHYLLYLLSSLMFIGQALIPVWFFMGIEQMKYITYINLISKSILTFSTFLIINEPADYIYANMLNGLGSLIAGVVCLLIINKKFGITFKIAGFASIKQKLKNSFAIFISNFSTNIYLNINIIILQFFVSDSAIGMYSVAEKVFSAFKNIISVIFQAIYPFACNLKQESTQKLQVFFTRYNYVSLVLFIALSLTIFYFAKEIVFILSGSDLPYAVSILQAFSFLPLIVTLSVPAFQTSLIFNLNKAFSYIMISAAIINISINVYLTYRFGALGTVAAIAITEAYVTIALNFLIIHKLGLNYFKVFNIYPKLNSF